MEMKYLKDCIKDMDDKTDIIDIRILSNEMNEKPEMYIILS